MTGPLSAGAGRARIALDAVLPVDGFDEELDPLSVRVLALDSDGRRVVIATVELTSLPDAAAASLQGVVAETTGAAPDDVLVVATHTFSAPHLVPPDALPTAPPRARALAAAVAEAARSAGAQAAVRLRAARLRSGRATAAVQVNRDVRTRDGWWLGADDEGTSSRDVQVIGVEGVDGAPIAALLHVGVQSSILNESTTRDGRRLVSADLAGAAARHVERTLGGDAVALVLPGAAGDQAPVLVAHRTVLGRDGVPHRVDLHEDGVVLVELLGERLGAAAIRAHDRATTVDPVLSGVRPGAVDLAGQVAPGSFRDLRPTTTYEFRSAPAETVPFWLLRIGDAALAAVRPELSASTGLHLEAASPFARTLPVTMVNGAAKYLPDAGSYDRITYEAMSSRYARGGAEVLADALVAALRSLHDDR